MTKDHEAIIDDVLRLAQEHPYADISRDFYRKFGKFSMDDVSSLFGTFRSLRSHIRKDFKPYRAKINEGRNERIQNILAHTDPATSIPAASGIYMWVNTSNLKVYVGQSRNLQNRHRQHRTQLQQGIHPNKHLQASWDVYGSMVFRFCVITLVDAEKGELTLKEQEFIDLFGSLDPNLGYNRSHAQPTRG